MTLAALALAVSCAFAPAPAPAPADKAAPAAQGAPKAKASVKGRIAIFDFDVKGGGEAYASLHGDIPDSLSGALIKGGVLAPLERRDLEKGLSEQELALSGAVDDATAARVGRLAGASYALLGSASIVDKQMRLSCRVIDIETAEILYAESVHGDAAKVFNLVDDLAAEVQKGFSK